MYSAYGVPFGLPGGDTDSDGDCDATDVTQVQTWINASAYDVRGDIDLDGDVDSTDKSIIQSSFSGTTLGHGKLSASAVASQKGLAGYQHERPTGLYHVRNRAYAPKLGAWLTRDPVPQINLYEYCSDAPLNWQDPMGLTQGGQGVGPWIQGSWKIWWRDLKDRFIPKLPKLPQINVKLVTCQLACTLLEEGMEAECDELEGMAKVICQTFAAEVGEACDDWCESKYGGGGGKAGQVVTQGM